MKNRPKPWIRPVDYHLECCIEARFWKIASTRKEDSMETSLNLPNWDMLGSEFSGFMPQTYLGLRMPKYSFEVTEFCPPGKTFAR
jgi:hypothetical protein